MLRPVRLSILDFSPPAGAVDLAATAEAAGYTRYWLGEHHSPHQSSNPLLLGAVLALANPGLRVGSGGVCLPYHAPLQVAEDARLVESMVPGRFDLGVTRGLAQEGSLSAALLDGRPPLSREGFLGKLAELHGLLTGRLPAGHPLAGHGLLAPPAPPLWLLGLSEANARWAGERGAGFCYSLHHAQDPDGAPRVLAAYRRAFRPSPEFPAPAALLAVSGLCAPTARELQAWERATEGPGRLRRTLLGTPSDFAAGLDRLARGHGVEEILILDSLDARGAERLAMYELIAGAAGLAPRAAAVEA